MSFFSPDKLRKGRIEPRYTPHELAAAILKMPCRNPNMPDDYMTADFEQVLATTAGYKSVDIHTHYPGITEKLAARLQEMQQAQVKAADDALALAAVLQKMARQKPLSDAEKDTLRTGVDWLAEELAVAQCHAAAPTEGLKAVPLNRRASLEQDMKAHQDYAGDLAALLKSLSILAKSLEPSGKTR